MATTSSAGLPYTVGTILTIRPHVPPNVAEVEARGSATGERQAGLHAQPAKVVWTPETQSIPHDNKKNTGAGLQQLRIIREIAVGQGRAQVVLCTVSPGVRSSSLRQFVAKIYDPRLYGDEDSDLLNNFPAEEVRWAALDHSREAAAYQHIESHKSTRPYPCTLGYYGSWAFQLIGTPSQSSKTIDAVTAPTYKHTICMLLLEYTPGCTVQELILTEPSPPVSQDYHLYVCARFCECEAWLEHIGLDHRDIAPRNVMLDPAPTSDAARRQKPRVILIDFNASRLVENKLAKEPESGRSVPRLPVSPILLFWHLFNGGFSDWAPIWVEGDIPRRRRWLIKTFGDDPRYQKPDGPLNPDDLDDWDRQWMKLHGFETGAKPS